MSTPRKRRKIVARISVTGPGGTVTISKDDGFGPLNVEHLAAIEDAMMAIHRFVKADDRRELGGSEPDAP